MTDQHVATPEPAATLILLRERDNHLEVFLLVRHEAVNFASGALVFPGGKVEHQDSDPALQPYLEGAHNDARQRSLQVAGIRETFEESGILLAREQGSAELISGERLASLAPFRLALHGGEISLLEFLVRERLVLACDQLVHFANWVTPTFKSRRFDTHFYVARIPADHMAKHDGTESVDSVWITPTDALAQGARDERLILFPTLSNIDRLARFTTADAAIAAAREIPVVPVSPRIEKRPDGAYLTIETGVGYTMTEEKIRRPL